ncbi:MAG: hypothetical protein GX791_01985 [Synergistaceae bacterium]|nr:hypothetical protein [Synergistaceae bacterium]
MKNHHTTVLCLLTALFIFSAPSLKNAAALELLVSGACSFQTQREFWSSSAPELRSAPGTLLLHVVNDGGRDEPWKL